MNARERAWHERQRHRFMRPDAERYLKPDWRDRKYWAVPPPDWAQHPVDVCLPPPERSDETKRLNALWREHFEAMRALIALKSELASELKAGFRRDQPRWPKRSGDDSGRWSGGAGTAPPEGGARGPTRGGHHFVPRKVFEKYELKPETQKVFEQGVTGRLHGQVHRGGREHEIYTRAVNDLFKQFLSDNGIESKDMTPDQAKRFLDEVKRSRDPRIRSFNLRIYMREVQYWLRRGPRND